MDEEIRNEEISGEEKITPRRNLKKYILPAILVVMLVSSLVLWHAQYRATQAARLQIENGYNKAVNDIASNITDIDVKLAKLTVVNTPKMFMTLLNDIANTASTTSGLMGQLPAKHATIGALSSFVTRIGDYCYILSRKIMEGQPILSEDLKAIDDLRKTCTEISGQLQQVIEGGGIKYVEVAGDSLYAEVGDGTLDTVGRETDKYPKLIYDGPFSESTESREPECLKLPEVSQDKAMEAAKKFLGNDIELTPAEDENGKIPSYTFTGKLEDGTPISLAVSKNGGLIVWMQEETATGEDVVPSEEISAKCAETAINFLKERGFEMKATYSQYYAGQAVINCAALQDGVILYNDLIKVWVDIQKNEVVGYEAFNYLNFHKEREIEQAAISEQDAKAVVSSNLQVGEGRLALIPTDEQKEVLCYEFNGIWNEQRYIVYINAKTGMEEDIFVVLDTQNGTMVQ